MQEISKEDASRFLSAVPEDKKFWCKNGQSFSTLQELESSLGAMDQETFRHHVNGEKNDFSTWIYDVIGNTELAAAIRNTRNKKQIARQLEKYLGNLKRAAN